MDDKTEKYLWEELKLLQPIIDKFDNLSFQIKKWFLGILVAVAGVAIVREKPALIIFNFFLVLVFYYAEAAYRTAHDSFLTRGRQIQRVLRGEETLEKSEMPPHLDRFLVHGDKELAALWKHMIAMARQPRVSGIYWLSLLGNLLLLVLSLV